MFSQKMVDLRDVVELPSKTVSITLGRAAVTSRVMMTQCTKMGDFSESLHLLSNRPLKRPQVRKPD
jgi:hypothetical protein